jgi:hypothetical protein
MLLVEVPFGLRIPVRWLKAAHRQSEPSTTLSAAGPGQRGPKVLRNRAKGL